MRVVWPAVHVPFIRRCVPRRYFRARSFRTGRSGGNFVGSFTCRAARCAPPPGLYYRSILILVINAARRLLSFPAVILGVYSCSDKTARRDRARYLAGAGKRP